MTVSAVAAAVDHPFFHRFRDFESAGLIFVQRPEMILLVKVSLAARRLIRPELFVAVRQQLTVTFWRDTHVLLLAGGAIAGKGKDIGPGLDHRVDDVWYLVDIGA